MTRRDVLWCIHEPFGDAFYFGPERLSERYAHDEEARVKSGFSNTTYSDVVNSIDEAVAKVWLTAFHRLNIARTAPAPSPVLISGFSDKRFQDLSLGEYCTAELQESSLRNGNAMQVQDCCPEN